MFKVFIGYYCLWLLIFCIRLMFKGKGTIRIFNPVVFLMTLISCGAHWGLIK